MTREVWAKTFKGIITNPIIIGIAAGLIWSALRIPMPAIVGKTVSNIGSCATPLGLMAMGATFDIRKAFQKRKTCGCGILDETGRFCSGFASGSGSTWISKRTAGGNPDHVRIRHNSQLLCYGKKYGT